MTTSQPDSAGQPPPRRSRGTRAVVIGAALVLAAALVTAGLIKVSKPISPAKPVSSSLAPPVGTFSHHPVKISLPTGKAAYLGAFAKGVPGSYAPVTSLALAAGAAPERRALLQRLVRKVPVCICQQQGDSTTWRGAVYRD